MSIWPYGSRFVSAAPGGVVPSTMINDVQYEVWRGLGGLFGDVRPRGIHWDPLGYAVNPASWSKGSPPPKWDEVVFSSGTGAPGIEAWGAGIQIVTDDGSGDATDLLSGQVFYRRATGGYQHARFGIDYGTAVALTNRVDEIGFYNYDGADTFFIGVRSTDGANWQLVVDDDTNSDSADLGVAPSSGTRQQIDLACISTTQVSAKVEGGSVVTLTLGGVGDPVALDDVAWIDGLYWHASLTSNAAVSLTSQIENEIYIADGRSVP